jgi:hypothetical protein
LGFEIRRDGRSAIADTACLTAATRAVALASGISQVNMVHLDGQTSNQLLETLAEWNEELEAHTPVLEPNM